MTDEIPGPDDPLSMARGIIHGVVIGIAMWVVVAIIAAVFWRYL